MAWRPLLLLAALGLLASPPLFAADAVDWARHAEADTVTVVTFPEEGEPRETTVWLVVVEGQGYIRTGSTRWGRDVERNPALWLQIDDEILALRAEFVEEEPLREQVTAAFREKYGWTDALIGIFRGGHPKIMKLLPRRGASRGKDPARSRSDAPSRRTDGVS